MSSWKEGGEIYLPTIAAREDQFAIPRDLLARVAFQECSWRPEVISYRVGSRPGAIGMFQLLPRFFPDAGKGWQSDSIIAGRELARLHLAFKDWQLAIAAYDWGQGNVESYVSPGDRVLPLETRNYVARVFSDVPLPGALSYLLQPQQGSVPA